MSLPEKLILAGPTTLPKISATEGALGGVVDPEYLINLKQVRRYTTTTIATTTHTILIILFSCLRDCRFHTFS